MYRPDSPLRLLGYLSNIVVGNAEFEQGVGVEQKQPDSSDMKEMQDPRNLIYVSRQLEKLRPVHVVVQQNDEQKDDSIVATVDNVVEEKVETTPSGQSEPLFDDLDDLSEEEDISSFLEPDNPEQEQMLVRLRQELAQEVSKINLQINRDRRGNKDDRKKKAQDKLKEEIFK